MKNFSRGGGFGGGRGGNGGGRSFGRRDSGRGGFGGGRSESSMHKVTCSDCGEGCEVPFRPTGNRPVYCDDCFRKNGGSKSSNSGSDFGGGNNFRERSFDRPRSDERPRFEAPAKPRENQYQEQFNMLNAKLDRILEALKPAKVKVEEVKEAEEKVVAKKAKAESKPKTEEKEVEKKEKTETKKAKPKAKAKK